MKLRFIWVGKTKSAPIKELLGKYLDRIRKFAVVEVIELRDRGDSGAGTARIIEKETEDMISRTASVPFLVVLDEQGRELDSRELAELFEKHRLMGTKEMGFVIGGHNGLGASIRERANCVLALSRMTFTHELARVLLTEQVYRAFAIIHDLPYQK